MDLEFTIGERFAPGSKVGFYPEGHWPVAELPPSGEPPAKAAKTIKVSKAGVVKVAGLTAGVRYFVGAKVAGEWRYVAVAA